MNIEQAVNILKPEGADQASLKTAYRGACKKYHPDINPEGLELMKVINAAYAFLTQNLGKWRVDQGSDNQPIDEIFAEILKEIRPLPGLNIEICGTWLWVTGETRPVKDILKDNGMRFAPKKKAWYWRPEGYRKRSRRVLNLNEIRSMFGSEEVQSEKRETLNMFS